MGIAALPVDGLVSRLIQNHSSAKESRHSESLFEGKDSVHISNEAKSGKANSAKRPETMSETRLEGHLISLYVKSELL